MDHIPPPLIVCCLPPALRLPAPQASAWALETVSRYDPGAESPSAGRAEEGNPRLIPASFPSLI